MVPIFQFDIFFRCIRSLTVSSNEVMAKHLLDKSPNYWQSSGGIGKNWIRLEMHENVLVYSLAITVSPADRSHMPSLVVVRVGDSVDTLKDFGFDFPVKCALILKCILYFPLVGSTSNRQIRWYHC